MNYASPAEVIGQLLQANGFGSDVTQAGGQWPVFVAHAADEIDEILCVYDTAGVQEGRVMKTAEMTEHFGIQILVRSTTPPRGWSKAKDVSLGLDRVYNQLVTVNGEAWTVQSFKRTSPILRLGMEEDHQRFLYTINGTVTLKES